MGSKRPSAAPLWVMATMIVVALTTYVGGYLLLGEYRHMGNYVFRIYKYSWEARMFEPLAWTESRARGIPVYSLDESVPVSW